VAMPQYGTYIKRVAMPQYGTYIKRVAMPQYGTYIKIYVYKFELGLLYISIKEIPKGFPHQLSIDNCLIAQ
jgi:hypothetical protein